MAKSTDSMHALSPRPTPNVPHIVGNCGVINRALQALFFVDFAYEGGCWIEYFVKAIDSVTQFVSGQSGRLHWPYGDPSGEKEGG